MHSIVAELIQEVIEDFDATTLVSRASAGGRYVSLTAEFTFQNKEQVNRLYAGLAACPYIRLVL